MTIYMNITKIQHISLIYSQESAGPAGPKYLCWEQYYAHALVIEWAAVSLKRMLKAVDTPMATQALLVARQPEKKVVRPAMMA